MKRYAEPVIQTIRIMLAIVGVIMIALFMINDSLTTSRYRYAIIDIQGEIVTVEIYKCTFRNSNTVSIIDVDGKIYVTSMDKCTIIGG